MQVLKRDRSRKFQVETLESRQLLSWTPTSIPRAVNMPGSYQDRAWIGNGLSIIGTVQPSSNPGAGYSYFTFTAPRTGTYSINVADTGSSRMATAIAVWQAPGNEIWAYYPSPSTNITGNIYLYAGTRYEVGINNENGYVTGSYQCKVTPPPLTAIGSGLSSDRYFLTTATASLSGSTLTVTLTGDNASVATKYTHRVDIYLLNARGQSLASWSNMTVTTAGPLYNWPWGGYSTHKSFTANYSLAGINLSGLTRIYLAVWN